MRKGDVQKGDRFISLKINLSPFSLYFLTLDLDQYALKRLYGLVTVIWFLLRRIAPASTWINEVAELMDSKPAMPGCTFKAMGFPDEAGLPRKLFGV
ncbi:hypothetical protein PU99_29215 [Pseudomonas putida]|nr:hypothetical protein PU99_29215 [Pseudomonas putida]